MGLDPYPSSHFSKNDASNLTAQIRLVGDTTRCIGDIMAITEKARYGRRRPPSSRTAGRFAGQPIGEAAVPALRFPTGFPNPGVPALPGTDEEQGGATVGYLRRLLPRTGLRVGRGTERLGAGVARQGGSRPRPRHAEGDGLLAAPREGADVPVRLDRGTGPNDKPLAARDRSFLGFLSSGRFQSVASTIHTVAASRPQVRQRLAPPCTQAKASGPRGYHAPGRTLREAAPTAELRRTRSRT